MKLPVFSADFGLPFSIWLILTSVTEILGSLIVAIYSSMVWTTSSYPLQFLYRSSLRSAGLPPAKSDRHIGLRGTVIMWSLTLLVSLAIWRCFSTLLLWLSVRKEIASLRQYWVSYKILIAVMSSFVFVASFTIPSVLPVAAISLAFDLVTCYFIILFLKQKY